MDPADRLMPTSELKPEPLIPGMPSKQAQSWGVVISIVVIVAMVVIGAFYAWGKRIAEQNAQYPQAGEPYEKSN